MVARSIKGMISMATKRKGSPFDDEWEVKLRCTGCGQNVFKLFPNCKVHERSHRRQVKLCYDQDTLNDCHDLVWDLEHIAEALIAYEEHTRKMIVRVIEKLDKKKVAASLRAKNSIIRAALQLPRVNNRLAVKVIDAREFLSVIAHDNAVNQLSHIKPTIPKKRKKAARKKPTKKKATRKTSTKKRKR